MKKYEYIWKYLKNSRAKIKYSNLLIMIVNNLQMLKNCLTKGLSCTYVNWSDCNSVINQNGCACSQKRESAITKSFKNIKSAIFTMIIMESKRNKWKKEVGNGKQSVERVEKWKHDSVVSN